MSTVSTEELARFFRTESDGGWVTADTLVQEFRSENDDPTEVRVDVFVTALGLVRAGYLEPHEKNDAWRLKNPRKRERTEFFNALEKAARLSNTQAGRDGCVVREVTTEGHRYRVTVERLDP